VSDGVDIPITTPGGPEGAATLRALAQAMKDLGVETQGAGAKADIAKSAFSFNQVSEAVSRVREHITQFADAVSELSSEQAQLNANSTRLGLNFDHAADAAGRFTDETEAMGAATRLAEAGINLTQRQLDSLTQVAARFAQNTGGTVASAVDTLTNGLITGSQRGLRPFGDELARAGGNSHTAEQRLAALTTQAGHTERATDDAASSMARFRDSIDDASRTMAHGFAEGVMRMTELGTESDNAAEKAESLNRTLHAIGASIGETIARVTVGVGELLGFVAIAVTSITSGIAAIGGGLVHLATGHVRGIGAAMTNAAQYGGIGAATDFTARMDEMRRQQDEAANRQASTAAPMAAPARPGVTMRHTATGGGGEDPETKALMARVQLMHDAATRERADLDRTIAVRTRGVELQRVLANGVSDELHARQQLADLTLRAAVSERNLDREQIERIHEIVEAMRAREARLTGAQRATIQHDINELLAEEIALTRRIEDAVHGVALANAQRYAAERTAFAGVEERERAEAAARARGRAAFSAPTSEREIGLGRAETLDERIEREREADSRIASARRAAAREDREAQQRLELEAVRDPAQQRFAIEESRRNHTIERERAHLTQRYEMQRTFVDRMEELHSTEADGTRALAEGTSASFGIMADAFGKHLQAFVTGKETIADALQGMLSDTLASIAQQATVKGAMELAEGISALAGIVTAPLAPGHFAAATAYFGVAALAGIGAAATAPSSASAAPPSAPAPAPESAARVSGSRGASESAGTVYNITFGGPMYGTGGVRQAARQMVGAINRGGIQGGVQLLPGVLQGAGAGT